MSKNKRIALGLFALLIIFNTTAPGQAAEVNNKSTQGKNKTKSQVKAEAKVPIVIEADQLYFSDVSGDLTAKGNVQIAQNQEKMLADEIRGNTKQTEVWIDGKVTFLEPNAQINGLGTRYNYGNGTGIMLEAKGTIGKERVFAKNIEILPDEFILHNGIMTKCPAEVPDYHVSADKVEIWPGEKLIAYNAKFWIKNTVIFSLPKYQKSLRENAESDFPQIGYHSGDGLFVKQHLEFPLSNNVAVFGDVAYYTNSGFKPALGLVDREKNFDLILAQGDFRDSDGHWIKKSPELRFELKPHRIGNSPVTYTFTGIYGKWRDEYKSSWHQDYSLYFSHDPIKLHPSLMLYLGTGYQVVKESFNNSNTGTIKFDATIVKNWSSKFTTWTGYHYTQNNSSVFDYNSKAVGKELVNGFSYKIDRMNSISFSQSYDLQNSKVYENYYTWNRSLHCWQASITYKAKEEKVQFDIKTTRW